MVAPPPAALAEMARLPPAGTPERLEWDGAIRQANELYPDWASISLGKARLSRTTYEQQHDESSEEMGPSPSRVALLFPQREGEEVESWLRL
jgi:hypothetical protein